MKRLWAPWRSKYVLNSSAEGCIFCTKPKEDKDDENFILLRGDKCFAIMNIYPYNNGHLMVAPYAHKASIEELNDEELAEMMKMVQRCVKALRKAYNPQGFNIGMNIGRVAGAGFEGHIHIHIVPRWNGDTNFMPVLADTKVVPISLDEVYKRLKEKL